MTPKPAATRPENGSASQKVKPEVARQQGEGIGADGVKCDVAEIEQTGQPDDNIETPAEHDVDQDRGAEVDQVARRERQKWQYDGKSDPGDRNRQRPATCPGCKAGEGPSRRLRSGRDEADGRGAAPAARRRPQSGDRHPIEMRADAERAATDVIGLQAHQRQGEEGGNQRRQNRVLDLRRPVEAGRVGFSAVEPGGGGHYTFSSSGRPSNPVGRKTSTRMRTTKTETSLYSTEK